MFAWLILPGWIGLIHCIYDRDIPGAGLVHNRLLCMYTNCVGLTHCVYGISYRRMKYTLNIRSLHGYPCKSSWVNLLYTCYQWLKYVSVNGSPATRPTKVGFYGCRAQHITILMRGRGPSLGVWVHSGRV